MSHHHNRAPVRPTPATTLAPIYALCAVLVVAMLFPGPVTGFLDAHPAVATTATVFVAIFVQALPFLALGVLVSGLIAAFASPDLVRRLLPRNRYVAVGAAGGAGMLLPGCECASVPVSRRLIAQGVPDAAALTFMLSAPAINPIVLVATAAAFPGEPMVVLARFTASLLTAVIVGALWSRFGRPVWVDRRAAQDDPRGSRWVAFSESARHDLLQAGGFLVVGAAVAAVLHAVVPPSVYEGLASQLLLAVLVMAVLAFVLALCSEADAFVVAGLSMVPLVPRLVFLVVGPAIDVKLAIMQSGAFGRSFALRFAPLTFAVATVTATVVGLVLLGGAP